MKDKTRVRLFSIFLSYITVLGLCVDMSMQDMSQNLLKQFVAALAGFSVTQLFLFLGLCALYSCLLSYIAKQQWKARDVLCVVIPAALFAAFMVVGYSFEETGFLILIVANSLQMAKGLLMWAGYFVAFSLLIAFLFSWLQPIRFIQAEANTTGNERGLWRRYTRRLSKHPFSTAFLTLFIAYIPYMVLSYPTILQGDAPSLILQGFNLPESSSNYLNLIDENVRLNGHHPIVYTLFIHVCLVVGNTLFHSYNIGFFLASFLQTLLVLLTMSYAIRCLVQWQVNQKMVLAVLAFFLFAPRVQNYMFLLTKDVLCAAALLLFILSLYELMRQNKFAKGTVLRCIFSGIGVGLLRNDGKYIILASLVLAFLLLKKQRRMLLVSTVSVVMVLELFFGVLMPAFHITPTSKREALSVPFQQTARYVRDYKKEVTEEEKAAISAVLNYSKLHSLYNPTLSDPVKGTYHEDATTEELIEYFKTWAKMGIKHPGVYIQAFINNYYSYFTPAAPSIPTIITGLLPA